MVPDPLRGGLDVLYGRFFVTLPKPTTTQDLSQQTIIVTGANRGLGFEASRHLSRLGVENLILAVRDVSKGEEAKQEILKSTSGSAESIQVWQLDMNDHESVKAFAAKASGLSRLDGVLANAGIMTAQFSLSDGIERTLKINVVSTFLLYLLLLPKLHETTQQYGPARFTIPNSGLHYMAPVKDVKDIRSGLFRSLSQPATANMKDYARYNLTKWLVLLVVREFAKRDSKIIINTPNPSFCKSDLARESQNDTGFRIGERLMARSTEEGSRALVHGILAGKETNGAYLNDCHIQCPAQSITGKQGQKMQVFVFEQLMEVLEGIHPGVSRNL